MEQSGNLEKIPCHSLKFKLYKVLKQDMSPWQGSVLKDAESLLLLFLGMGRKLSLLLRPSRAIGEGHPHHEELSASFKRLLIVTLRNISTGVCGFH